MEKAKVTIEVETDDDSRVSARVLSSYILRAIAGVAGANRAIISSYRFDGHKGAKQNEES